MTILVYWSLFVTLNADASEKLEAFWVGKYERSSQNMYTLPRNMFLIYLYSTVAVKSIP